MLSKWTGRIIGLMFLAAGLYMVISDNINEAIIMMISVFAAAYWWDHEL